MPAMLVRRGLVAIFFLVAAAGCAGRSGGLETGGNLRRLAEADVNDPLLQKAATLADAGEPKQSFRVLKDWFKLAPASELPGSEELVQGEGDLLPDPAAAASRPFAAPRPGRPQALFLAANTLIARGKRIKAFYYLDELLDNYPGSVLYRPAAEKQYAIAASYFDGKTDLFLGLPVSRRDEALEMMFRVQNRLPGSPLAERALRRSADFYYARGDYDFAEDAYGVFIDRFPRSPQVADVRLLQAYSNVRQFKGEKYDPTPLIDARAQLQQYAAQYPEQSAKADLPKLLAWIDRQLAGKLTIESDFYRRTSHPAAARAVSGRLAKTYPQTDAGREASASLERHHSPSPPTTAPAARGGE